MSNNHSLMKNLFKEFISEIKQGLAVINSVTGILEQCNYFFAKNFDTTECNLIGKNISEIIPDFNNFNSKAQLFLAKKIVFMKKIPISNEIIGSYVLLFLSEDVNADEENKSFLITAFKTALDYVDEGILISDSCGKVVYCNNVQLQFDGNSYEDVIGRYSWDAYNLDKKDSTFYKCLQTGESSKTYIHYYLSKTGQYIRVTGNNYIVKKEGKTVGVVGIDRDLKSSEETIVKIIELQKKIQNVKNEREKYPEHSKYDNHDYSFKDIIGESEAIRESLDRAKIAAKSDSYVFLCGETGTGKEMFAQSIHYASSRKLKPLISINCAAIPDSLLEGIIFGTVKGIYTGADNRKGLFEEADGGTLFLDEINSLPINLQGKLLRALEEKKIRRLGGKNEISVNVRIISSCNIDPQLAIAQNQLRSDLYYRLAVFDIKIPPLRERKGDIAILAEYFIKIYNFKFGKNIKDVSPSIMQTLLEGDWPGNCRQLKHWIEYAMNLVPSDQSILTENYTPYKLNNFIRTDNAYNEIEHLYPCDKKKEVELFKEIHRQETGILIDILKRNHGNITKAAKEMGISRQGLQYRMRKLGIK